MVREVGKPIAEARAEVARAIAILRYYAQAALDPGRAVPRVDARDQGGRPASRWASSSRSARGTSRAIPIWKAAPALAYGNAVISKSAGPAVAAGALLAEIAAESLPTGVSDGGGDLGLPRRTPAR